MIMPKEIYMPNEILESIFNLLPIEAVINCTAVSMEWKSVADTKKFWEVFMREKLQGYIGNRQLRIGDSLIGKHFFVDLNKSKLLSVFSRELVDSLGGEEKIKTLPYLNFSEPRILKNGIIEVSELNAPLTVGRLATIPMSHKKNQPIEPSEITRYFFLAIRFTNREFNPRCNTKDCNIWITEETSSDARMHETYYLGEYSLNSLAYPKKEKSWMLISGGNIGGWPTRFPSTDGRGEDFSKTIEYIGRLVRGEPCGIRDICSPIEHSKVTLGSSTMSLS